MTTTQNTPHDHSISMFIGTQPDTERDAYLGCHVQPSLTYWRDGVSVFGWALDAPVSSDDLRVIALLDFFGMETPDEPLPSPDDGWEVVHDDPTTYTVEGLHTKYIEETPAEASEEDVGLGMYGDAKIITPYNESEYEGRLITVTIGSNQFSKNWKPQQLPLTGLIHQFTKHQIGKKDGLAIVLADMVAGQRVKKAVKTCTAIGLDIDNGVPTEVIDEALAKLGCLAIRATTHSNGKESSEISKDEILKFHEGAEEITSEMIQQFLLVKKHWDQGIVDTIEFIEEDHTDKGIVCRISHAPMEKHRVIVPLEEPYVIADEGRTQMEAMAKWAKVPAALAEKLGVPFDRSCTDPSRLYYLARHDMGRPYNISLFGGPLFKLEDLSLDGLFDNVGTEFAKSGGSKAVTREGKLLAKSRWWPHFGHSFQGMDAICDFAPDRNHDGKNIVCAFDEDHSNAGDPNDRACFAVNAADGGNEFCTVKCQHAGCADKAGLDHWAKMVKDGHIPASVLTDPDYNIADEEIDPKTLAAIRKTIEGIATGVEEDAQPGNRTKEELLEEIALFTKDTTVPEIDAVLKDMIKSDLSPLDSDELIDAIVDKTKRGKQTLKGQRALLRTASTTVPNGGLAKVPEGYEFSYVGQTPDFVEAKNACATVIKNLNHEQGLPIISMTGQQPVRLVEVSPKKYALQAMTVEQLWAYASEHLTFVAMNKETGSGPRQDVPTRLISQFFHEAGKKVLPPSPKICTTPQFLSNGKLLFAEGYHYHPDDPAGVNHLLNFDFGLCVVPIEVTRDDALEARDWLLQEILGDFPFYDTCHDGSEGRGTGEAHSLAMLIEREMRDMIEGRSPLYFATKPKAGTGGSALVKAPGLIFEGREPDITEHTEDEDEMQKRVLATRLSGNRTVFLDDIPTLHSKTLLRCITAEFTTGRLLGGNSTASMPNDCMWSASGMNISVDDQMDRRIIWLRLNARLANFKGRKFRYGGQPYLDLHGNEVLDADGNKVCVPTLEQFIKENRGLVIQKIIILIQYWINCGMPKFTKRKRDGFEDWCKKVGGVLQCVDMDKDFLFGKDGAEASYEMANDNVFANAWYGEYQTQAVTVSELFALADGQGLGIVTGKSDSDKREKFDDTMQRLNGNPFVFEINGSVRTFFIEGKVGKAGYTYEFQEEMTVGVPT